MNSIATCLNRNEKGIFSTVIIALLILILLGVLVQIIAAQKNQNETIESIITTKHLTSQRANFEYNIANVLKEQLEYDLNLTQNEDFIEPNIDKDLNTILQDYGITTKPNTELELTHDNSNNNSVNYNYTIINEMKKTITYNNKTIVVKIPANYSIMGSVIFQ